MNQTSTDLANRRVERRRRPRTGVRVTCLKGVLGLGTNLAVAVLDASETGIRILARAPLEKGQEIEISVVGPGRGRPHVHAADVVWCVPAADNNYCVGAHFHERLSYANLHDICV